MYGLETYDPAPARALDASSGRVEFFLELIHRSPALADGSLQRAILEHAAVALALGRRGREVLPEERVVDVACRHTRDIRSDCQINMQRGIGVVEWRKSWRQMKRADRLIADRRNVAEYRIFTYHRR